MTGLDSKTILEWIRAAKAKGVGLEVETKREPIGAIIVRSVNGEVGESTLHTYGDAIAEFLEGPQEYSGECISSLMSTVEQMEKKAS